MLSGILQYMAEIFHLRDGPLDIWWGVGQIPKKHSRTEKIQKKNIVHNKPIEKKNRARTRGEF
jgi:hypothetical protein